MDRNRRYSFTLFIELFLLMPYQYIKIIPYVYDITVYLKYAALLFEIILLVSGNRYFQNEISLVTRTELNLVVFILYQTVISLWKGSTSITTISSYLVGMLLVFLMLNRNIKDDLERTMRTLSLYFLLAITVNLFSLLIFPEGLYTSVTALGAKYTNYFLGLDNAFGIMLFPGAVFICFTEEMFDNRKPVLSVVSLIMILITYLKTMSGSGLCATIILIIFYIFHRLHFGNHLLSLKFLLPLIIIVSVGLIMGNSFLYDNATFSNFVTSVLEKDISFSSRTLIWNAGVIQFLKHPFWGYGKYASDCIVYIWGANRIAHNFWLQLVLEGGLVGTCIYILFMYNSITDENINASQYTAFRIFDIGIFAFFVYLLMESSSASIPVTMLFLTMAMASRKISAIFREENESEEFEYEYQEY